MVRECQKELDGAKNDAEEANGPGFQNGLEECME